MIHKFNLLSFRSIKDTKILIISNSYIKSTSAINIQGDSSVSRLGNENVYINHSL